MAEQNPRPKNSQRLLSETKQEYISHCLKVIQASRNTITAMNKMVLSMPATSETISEIINSEKKIIAEQLEGIRAEQYGKYEVH